MGPPRFQSDMKILTWNIRHGGRRRLEAILDRLFRHDADIIVLTEFRNNDAGEKIQEQLDTAGWEHRVASEAVPNRNGVLVASRAEIVCSGNLAEDLPEPHRLLDVRFDNLRIVGVYMPSLAEKLPYWDRLLDAAPKLVREPALMIGDFNTGMHHLDEAGATFIGSDRMERLEESGFLELWRAAHPDQQEFTWFSNQGNGFRLDHAFASPPLRRSVSKVYYSHDERTEKISDHSALIVTLKQST